jgi:TonB family protein
MTRHLLAFALLCGVAAAQPAQITIPGFESMQIEARGMPNFPVTLIGRGITTGTVRVVIKVDETGRLDDWLVVAYTHETLARSAVDALKRWKYTPARLNGEPVSAQAEMQFTFRVEGVVVSQNMVEHFLARARGDEPEFVYRPSTLRELDRIPTPVHVVSPNYSPELAQRGIHGDVTVEFYIDEKGQVRLPVVPGNQPPELTELAVAAVSQWTFEPPTRRGQPVLVQVRQVFHFEPANPG